MERVKLWLKAKVLDPGVEYIKSGAEPKTLAASAAAGFCNGLCPVLGVSAGLTMLMVLASRGALHGPMALLANFISVPVELALILPYVRVGEWITGSPRVELKPVGITDLFKQGSGDLLRSVGCALLAWALTWPLVAGGVYLATVPGFQLLRRKYMHTRGSDAELDTLSSSSARAAAETRPLHSVPLLPVAGVSSDGSVTSIASRRSSSGGNPAEWK
jgi:uncharacterized protein (DUF2062 family)